MKKALLLLALLCTALTWSQDKELIESLNNLDYEHARQFADEIAANSKTKWVHLHDKENGNSTSIIYVNSNVDEKRKALLKSGKRTCESGECFQVSYMLLNANDGAGKLYRFRSVTLKFEDIFPTWKKYFIPTADIDKTKTDYKLKEYKQGNALYVFKSAESPYWTIEKFY